MSGDKDFSVGAIGAIPGVPAGAVYAGGIAVNNTISKKPHYLILLKDDVANKVQTFIAIDKPDLLEGFVQVKGFYSNESQENIIENFLEISKSTAKDDLVEILFPWHRINSIRSLVFNAQKSITPIK